MNLLEIPCSIIRGKIPSEHNSDQSWMAFVVEFMTIKFVSSILLDCKIHGFVQIFSSSCTFDGGVATLFFRIAAQMDHNVLFPIYHRL